MSRWQPFVGVLLLAFAAGCATEPEPPPTFFPVDSPAAAADPEPEPEEPEPEPEEEPEPEPKGVYSVGATTNYSHKTNTLDIEAMAPLGSREGDLLVAQLFVRSGPVTPPDGWTLVTGSADDRQTVWVKVATDDEPGGYVWMQGDPDRLGRSGVILAAYRGVDPESPVVSHAFSSEGEAPRMLTAPSVDTEADGAVVLRMWSTQSPGGSHPGIQPPPEVTERARVIVPISRRAAMTFADAVQEEAGPSGTASALITWEADRSYNHTVVLRPLE